MSRVLLKEAEIGTVGELKAALDLMPDQVPVVDVFEEPLLLSWYRDEGTGEELIEIT